MNAIIEKRKRGELVTGYLTQREVDILARVATGLTSRQISSYLGISIKTCGKHRAELCRKLHAQSAVDLTRRAIELGVVTVDVTPMKRTTVRGFTRWIL